MPKYVIDRPIPGAGALSDDDIRAISEKSNSVLADMAGRAQWLHSYVTDDNIFCVYVAPDEATVREHATRGGFPVTSVNKVARVIDPTTGGL